MKLTYVLLANVAVLCLLFWYVVFRTRNNVVFVQVMNALPSDKPPTHLPENVEYVQLAVSIGEGQLAVYATDTVNSPTANRLLIFCLGGNTNVEHNIELFDYISSPELHVVMWDYRNSGRSTGDFNEQTSSIDLVTIIRWARNRYGETLPLTIWGHSLGCTVTMRAIGYYLSKNTDFLPERVVLQSPFCRVSDMVGHHIAKGLHYVYYLTGNLDITKEIEQYTGDSLIIGCEDDQVTPIAFAEELYKASLPRGEFLQVPNQNHKMKLEDVSLYQRILNFILKGSCTPRTPGRASPTVHCVAEHPSVPSTERTSCAR